MKKSLLFALICSSSLFGAPSSKETSILLTLQEFRAQMDQTGYQLNSQKVDLDLLQEKFHDLDNQIATLKKQLSEQNRQEGELTKDRLTTIEKRLTQLEKTQDTVIADLQQIKTHYNESAANLAQCKTKLSELDKQVSTDIKTLKKAVESLVGLLNKPKDQVVQTAIGTHTYKVKPGDSLGKIAQDNHIDIKTLKELNRLENDKIVVGQTLNLP